MPADERALFDRILAHGAATVTIRERTRQPVDDGDDILAEVLVARGRYGRVSTWQIKAHPRDGAPDRFEVADVIEVAAVDGLLRLTLDTSKQYAVHNLVVQAPDLTLHFASGFAFAAETDDGITALVLRGEGDVRFSPPDPAEQGQLRIFDGHSALESSVDSAFLRINPDEFASRISEHSLTPVPVSHDSVDRGQAIFDELAPKTYSLDLTDLAQDRWSLTPPFGSVVVEFHSRRFGWLTYVRSPGDTEDITLFDRAHQHNLAVYSSADKLAARGSPFYSEDEQVPYDVERYGIDLTIDPTRQFLSGRGSLKVRVKNDTVNLMTFRLAESLTVSSVSSPNFGRLLALRVVGQNNFIVSLPQPVTKDTELVFDVVYSGRLNPQTIDHEAADVEPDQVPTDQSAQRSDQVLQIDPEPRFLYSNHVYWYPQSPVTDYATAAMRLKVPSEFQVVASGTLTYSTVVNDDSDTGSREPRSMRVVEFNTDRPARYLSCLISRFVPSGHLHVDLPAVAPPAFGTPAAIAGAPAAPGVNIEVVSTPARREPQSASCRSASREIVKAYTQIVGEAPYPDLHARRRRRQPARRAQPAVLRALARSRCRRRRTTGATIRSRSTARIRRSSSRTRSRISGGARRSAGRTTTSNGSAKGFAQYFAALYAGADRGPDLLHTLMVQMRERAEEQTRAGPDLRSAIASATSSNDGRVFRAIIYNKSAVVLHMLRRLDGRRRRSSRA